MNNVNIIGRLTKDPESAKNNDTVCVFSIAVSGSSKDETYFFDCVAFKKTAELIFKYVKKGNQLGISGSLKQDRWEGQDGQKRAAVKIIVNQITFTTDNKKDEANDSEDWC